MPWLSSAPHFLAAYLVFVEGSIAATLITVVLYHRAPLAVFRWAVLATMTLLLSFVFALVGTSVYFTAPVVPVPAGSVVNNSFPSHHALLATAIVALVFLTRRWWAVPFAGMTLVIDIALVAERDHHVIDVVGSTIMVALAVVITLITAPVVISWLNPPLSALAHTVSNEPDQPEDSARPAVLTLRRRVDRRFRRQEDRLAMLEAELARLRADVQALRAELPESREDARPAQGR